MHLDVLVSDQIRTDTYIRDAYCIIDVYFSGAYALCRGHISTNVDGISNLNVFPGKL